MFEFQLTPQQVTNTILLTVIVLFETFLPFRQHYGRLKHYGKNAFFSVINSMITGIVSSIIYVYVFLSIEKNHLGLIHHIPVPPLISVLIVFLMFDLWLYVWHRLNHAVPFLWRFHQVHHNDINMDVSTSLRFHPGETLMSLILNIIIFVALGMKLSHIVIYKVFFHAIIYIHHSNIAVPEHVDRLLRLVIVSPNMHRVHHSIKRHETDSNYASVFSFWDRIFKTFRESDPDKITFGLEEDRSTDCQTFWYLLKRPFQKSHRR